MSKLVCVLCSPRTATAVTAALCPACQAAGWASLNLAAVAAASGQTERDVLESVRDMARWGWMGLREITFPNPGGSVPWLAVVFLPTDALLHHPDQLPPVPEEDRGDVSPRRPAREVGG